MRLVPACVLVVLPLALSGCNASRQALPASAPPPAATARVTPEGFQMPGGSGCAGDIARYRAVQDNDRALGHVNPSVYDQIQGEIAEAERACTAGDVAQANALLRASKARHGYPLG
jgi:hypothetical protein